MMEDDNYNGMSEEQLPKEEREFPKISAKTMDERLKEEANLSLVIPEDRNNKIIGETDRSGESQRATEMENEPRTPKGEEREETNKKQDESDRTDDFANELLQSTEEKERICNGHEVHLEDDDSIMPEFIDIDERIRLFTFKNPFRREEDPEVRAIRHENMKKTCTPLMHAAAKGRRSWIKTLLEKGSSVRDTDSEGNTAMHFAARGGHDSCVKMLQGNGGKPSARNKEGHTPLHYAARWGHEKVTEILLSAGANSSTIDERRLTPLHWAAAWNHCETIKVFLRHGADRRIKSTEGHTADDIAVMFGHKEVSTILREEFPSVQDFLENNGNSQKTREGARKTRRKRRKKPHAVTVAASLMVQEMLALFDQE